MTLPRTVADVLARHVTFEVESIDRMYCNVYQPKLQYSAGAAGFFVGHRGFTYASSALMAQMSQAYVPEPRHVERRRARGLVIARQFMETQRVFASVNQCT
jgi:hypothetical protein